MKFKPKSKTIYKKHEGDTYIFKNGIAKVPDIKIWHRQISITLKEFHQLCLGASK